MKIGKIGILAALAVWPVVASAAIGHTADTLRWVYECPWNGQFDTTGGYLAISASGMYCGGYAVGSPVLPTASRIVMLPHGSTIQAIEHTASAAVTLSTGIYHLLPSVGANIKSADSAAVPIPDAKYYQTDAYLRTNPLVTAEHMGTTPQAEVYRIVVAPFAYNAVRHSIEYTPNIEVRLLLSGSTQAEASQQSPQRLLVVARRNFRQGLQPFVRWKRHEGYDVSELYVDTNLRDTVKAAMQPYFNSHNGNRRTPDYVLIVGDAEQIQAFVGYSRPEGLPSHPTDLPYANFQGGYLPQAYVGRWPVADTVQLAAVVSKTLQYEQWHALDTAPMQRLLLVAGAENSNPAPTTSNGQVNYVAREAKLTHPGIDTIVYHNPTSSTQKADILANIRRGASLLNYTAHCSTAGWTLPNFTFADVDTMSDNHPMFYVNNCCLSNQFTGTCFGEELLRKPVGGAVGVIGATNSTLWDEDYYWAVGPKYPFSLAPQFDSTRLGAFDHWGGRVADVGTAGQILHAGNMAVAAFGSPYARFYWEIYCLLGDPTMRPYLGVPHAAALAVDSGAAVGSTMLYTNATPAAVVSAVQADSLLGVSVADAAGVAILRLRRGLDTGSVIITATGQNLIPCSTTVQVAPHEGALLVGNVVATDSSVAVQICNHGHNAVHDIVVQLQQDTASMAEPLLAVADASVDSLMPDSCCYVVLPYSVAVLGQSSTWHAQVVVSTAQWCASVAASHTIDTVYPVLSYYFMTADGNPTSALRPNVQYTLVQSIAGAYDTARIRLASLPDTHPLQPIFSLSEADAYLRVDQYLSLGRWRNHKVDYLRVGGNTDGFEQGLSCYPWQSGGTLPWTVDSTRAHSGQYSLRSGAIAGRQTSDLVIEVDLLQNDSISFWSLASTEPEYDKLVFTIDGSQRMEDWGRTRWTQWAYPLSAGHHTLRWRYIKDDSRVQGDDCVWIDDIVLPAAVWAAPHGCDAEPTQGIARASIPTVGLMPNPTTGKVSIQCGADAARVQLIDVYGRVVWQQATNGNALQADLSHLAPGMYICLLRNRHGSTIAYTKLIIQR